MRWKRVSWCGVSVYVQRLSVFEQVKRFFEDQKVKKIKNI